MYILRRHIFLVLIIHTSVFFILELDTDLWDLEEEEEEEAKTMASMAGPDHLFNLRNHFYLGAYQAAINNSEIPNLSQEDIVERDCLVHRAYIALGSYQVLLPSRVFRFGFQFVLIICWFTFFKFRLRSLSSVRSMKPLLLLYRQWNSLLCIYRVLKTR